MTNHIVTMKSLVLRAADEDDMDALMAFYGENASEALPCPSVATMGRAIDMGRLYVVEPATGGTVLATAAIFDYSPPDWRTYVGELSGACVAKPVRGFAPLGLHRLLLGVRLLGAVAGASEPSSGTSATLVTVVKTDNAPSIANVTAAGFSSLQSKPPWLVFDERSWNGKLVETEWSYFIADDGTVRQAFADLRGIGFFDGMVRMSRTDRDTGEQVVLSIRLDLADLTGTPVRRDLEAIHSGERRSGLGPPPTRLVK